MKNVVNSWETVPKARKNSGDQAAIFLPQAFDFAKMVRVEGLEPPRLAAPEPKFEESRAISSPWLFYCSGHIANESGKRETPHHRGKTP